MFDRKKVSRERVIGISFVDILIQAIFVLMIAFVVGYVDPVQKLQLKEFFEAGKDLCKKRNKDSMLSCREFLKEAVLVEKDEGKYADVGADVCKKVGIEDPSKCKAKVDEIVSANNLRPCLKFTSKTSVPPSTYWSIVGPNDIVFDRFSDEYVEYVKKDSARAKIVASLGELKGKHFTPPQVNEQFGFIREDSCFHAFSLKRLGAFSDTQISGELSAIQSLRKLRQ